MTFQKRASSIDMTLIELRDSPAPTYCSTFDAQDWPLSPQSNNLYHQPPSMANKSVPTLSNGKAHKDDMERSPIKPDYHDSNHPHFVEPSSRHSKHYSPPLPPRRRWPQKRVLIPWILAILFFLTTLWFTSIALGARFLLILHPQPVSPTVQEINVLINGESLHGSITVSTTTFTQLLSTTMLTTQTPTPTEVRNGDIPMRTGILAPEFEGAPIDGDKEGSISTRLKRLVEPKPTGFVTVTRTMPST